MTPKSDEELCRLACGGERDALDELVCRFLPAICARADAFSRSCPLEPDDLAQEGFIGFLSAVSSFDSDASSFSAFALLCAERAMLSAIKFASRKKRRPDGLVSLDDDDSLPDTGVDPESVVIAKDGYERIREQIINSTSPLERRVLLMRLDGMTYAQIARSLGSGTKTVDNAIQRLRKKIPKD